MKNNASRKKPAYVLLTPVRNERKYIEGTILSVALQSLKPLRWVIVSDGSTDGTDDIVIQYQTIYPFITFVRLPEKQPGDPSRVRRTFASKAVALNFGRRYVNSGLFEYIGNLDADVTFRSDYYERIIAGFEREPRLGLASGVIVEKVRGRIVRSKSGIHHPAGAIQLFRRECFEQIGGYRPVSLRGMDTVAAVSARMQGWETRMFRDLEVRHHKVVEGDLINTLRARFDEGKSDYNVGMSFILESLKTMRRLTEWPILLSAFARFVGFLSNWHRKAKLDVSDAFKNYYCREQFTRLRALLRLGNPMKVADLSSRSRSVAPGVNAVHPYS